MDDKPKCAWLPYVLIVLISAAVAIMLVVRLLVSIAVIVALLQPR